MTNRMLIRIHTADAGGECGSQSRGNDPGVLVQSEECRCLVVSTWSTY